MDATGTVAKSGLSKVLRRRFSFTFSRFNRRYDLENVTSFPRRPPRPLIAEHFRIETIVLFHNNFAKVARTRLSDFFTFLDALDITGPIYAKRCATSEDMVACRARVMI